MGAVFGRDRELAHADTLLESAAGRSGSLLLEGEPGIGKTTVWREVVSRAEDRGFRVLAAQPAEAETKLALSAVADLLEGVPEPAFAALPDPQRRALEVALLRVAPGAAAPEPRTLATGLRSLLAELTAEAPLLVAIDDVQWVDLSSARMLAFALRRLPDERVRWLFAQRLGVPTRLAVDELVPPESLERLTIGPLTLAALHHLLEERLHRPLSRSVLVRVHG
ncbi:MAG TPA: ATP-binding protein, partial [Actinomycetota bacterium]|nr:ATP-binding protein [Actinomycetota bacterium]